MTQEASAQNKIPTESPQRVRSGASRPARRSNKTGRPARSKVLVSGTGRESTRGGGEVIELGCGITVYPARSVGGRWRAVWYEAGERQQCEAATEERLAARLEKVTERLRADAPNMRRPGADLIAHYLDPDRLPVRDRWSRKHADTQRRLCQRFAAPVIAAVTCQDIKTDHTQKIVNAAPTAGEGDRVHRMLSALVTAGIDAGYLTSPRLAKVHWQPAGRPLPEVQVSVAGESALWVDPAEIPSDDDVGRLGRALAAGAHGDRDELMASTAAYTGLRWGELTALTIAQVDQAARVIAVDRKIVEVGGHLYAEAPKNRKRRRTIYPRRLPARRKDRRPDRGGPRRAGDRDQPARADLPLTPGNALALLQLRPARPGPGLPGSRLARRRRQRHLDLALTAARVLHHRPVHLEARRTDVSRMAGHANYRITLDMYIGATAGVLSRARTVTE
jgi:integrase